MERPLIGDGKPAKSARFYFVALLVLSLSFLLVYTAFSAIQNLAGPMIGSVRAHSLRRHNDRVF